MTCIKKLNLEANECVAVEDSEYGIKAAKGAGLICIAKKMIVLIMINLWLIILLMTIEKLLIFWRI